MAGKGKTKAPKIGSAAEGKVIMDSLLQDLDPPKQRPHIGPRVKVRTQRNGKSIMNDEVLKDLDGKKEAPKPAPKPAPEAPKPGISDADKAANRSASERAKSAWSQKAPPLPGDLDAGKSVGKSIEDITSMSKKGAQDRGAAAVKKVGSQVARNALKAVPGLGIASTLVDILSPTPVADATTKGKKEFARPGGGTSANRPDYKVSEEKPARKPAAPAPKPSPKPAAKAPGKPASKPAPGLSEDDKIKQLTAKGYSQADATNLARAKSTKATPAFSKGGLVGSGKGKKGKC